MREGERVGISFSAMGDDGIPLWSRALRKAAVRFPTLPRMLVVLCIDAVGDPRSSALGSERHVS